MARGEMKALSISEVTPAERARLCDVPVPETKPGWTLVRVCGFGMNHSEQVLRLEEIEAGYIKRPVPGTSRVPAVSARHAHNARLGS